MMKICIRCHVPKPLDEFGNYSRYPDGKQRYCRLCWNAIVNARRHANGTKPVQPFLERLWGSMAQCGHEDVCPFCCWPWTKALSEDGYGKFSTTYNGQALTHVVTQVVWEVWNARPFPTGMCACHYCDNPACCNPLHLWIGTREQNRIDCVTKGRQARGINTGVHTQPEAFPRGERHPKAKLTEQDVRDIRETYAAGIMSSPALAQRYGVAKPVILAVIHRRTWKHI
jgi:hypothetical protein